MELDDLSDREELEGGVKLIPYTGWMMPKLELDIFTSLEDVAARLLEFPVLDDELMDSLDEITVSLEETGGGFEEE